MSQRYELLRGGPADIDVIVNDDQSSFTIVRVTEAGDDRLETGQNGGGHVEFRAHPVPGGGLFEQTESGHLSVPPG